MTKIMKPIIRWLAWKTLSIIIRLGLHLFLSYLYGRLIKEMDSANSIKRAVGKENTNRPTALVLSYEQFRGDIECLAATKQVRILVLNERWLSRLMFQFYPLATGKNKYLPFFSPTPADITWEPKKRYRKFLRNFLPQLFERFSVDLVIGHHMHRGVNFDWGAIADQIGYPYVVINRENLFVSEYVCDAVKRRLKKLGQFEGSYVTVHNKIAQKIFSGSGMVPKRKLPVLGCIRMDRFLKQIENSTPPSLENPIITFFTYFSNLGKSEINSPHEQCKNVHRLLVEIARENPHIEVYFKVKPNFYGSWKPMLEEAIAGSLATLDQTPNLHISTTIPAHDLIERSNVVIGFNSTTVLEASIANRHVIVPYFGPWRERQYSKYIYLPNAMHLFNVPSSIEDLKKMIFVCLKNHKIADGLLNERRNLFEEYVSPLDGTATEAHIELINSVCQNRNRLRLKTTNE